MRNRLVKFYRICLMALAVGLALAATSALIAQANNYGFLNAGDGGAISLPPNNPSGPGTITGTIYYTGKITGTHTVWVGAFTTTQGGPPAYSAVRSGPGPYTLTVDNEGVYTIMGGMDGDDPGGPPNPAVDPLGSYAHNPVTVTTGAVVGGVDLILLDPAEPPTNTSSIRGQISYTGYITTVHNIIVFASRWGEQGAPGYAAVIPGPGPYTITNVPSYTYTVGAFMDLGDNMGPPEPGEPFSWYDPNGDGSPDPVIVLEGVPVSGINISLRDRLLFIYLPVILKE